MSSHEKREKLFNTATNVNDLSSQLLDEEKIDSWGRVILLGIIQGVFVFFLTLVTLFVLDVYLFPGIFNQFNLILGLEATMYFFLSFFVIWFAPSPSWAHFKSRFVMKPAAIQASNISLRIGMRRMVVGFVLMFLVI